MKNRIYLSSPHMSEEGYELQYIKEAFDTNWIAPLGPNVNGFEKELVEKIELRGDAAALTSGTAAIHLALKLSGIKKGDKVFCQSLTFSGSANPIMYEGAIPVFIDSDYMTWNMCPIALEKAFKKYPNTKAVIVVNLYGISANLNEIKLICEKYNARLIEDAAESLGTKYNGVYSGTIGDYGIYSFNGNKIITTSGGGMLVSKNIEDIAKSRFYSTQSKEPFLHYEHNEVGYNYRMSNVVAGIGRGQLKVLEQRVKKKQFIYNYYKEKLSELKDIGFMPENDFDEPNFWLSCILTPKEVNPLKIIEALSDENIEARPIWKPMHLQPVFKDYEYIGTNVSEYLYERGLCLPSDTKMNNQELDRVCETIKKVWCNSV